MLHKKTNFRVNSSLFKLYMIMLTLPLCVIECIYSGNVVPLLCLNWYLYCKVIVSLDNAHTKNSFKIACISISGIYQYHSTRW